MTHLKTSQRQAVWAYIFLAPALIFFVLFFVAPVLRTVQFSLYYWPLGSPNKEFIGLENYRRLFSEDPLFITSIGNTLAFTLGTLIPTLLLALLIAIVLNQAHLRGRQVFRTIYFIPVVSSLVAISFVWRWLLEPSFGLVNFLIRLVGLKGPGWLASPEWALRGVMLVSIWRDLGFYMVIFLAGLQTIPRDFIEAAMVDGATAWQRFWRITLPLLNPTLVFAAIIGAINGLQVFTQIYTMTGSPSTLPGGPLNSTRSVVLYVVESAFRSQNIGYASAAAFVLFLLVLIVSAIQLRLIEKPFDY